MSKFKAIPAALMMAFAGAVHADAALADDQMPAGPLEQSCTNVQTMGDLQGCMIGHNDYLQDLGVTIQNIPYGVWQDVMTSTTRNDAARALAEHVTHHYNNAAGSPACTAMTHSEYELQELVEIYRDDFANSTMTVPQDLRDALVDAREARHDCYTDIGGVMDQAVPDHAAPAIELLHGPRGQDFLKSLQRLGR